MDLGGWRRSYEQAVLDDSATADSPAQQFEAWLAEAAKASSDEANAMTLATATPEGRPSTRVVLLKEIDDGALIFYTNYRSRKGEELAENPFAAAQFYWPALERVVRTEGRVEQVDAATSDAYFAQRPLDSRLGAWASPQSQPLESRLDLVTAAAKAAATHGLNPPRPPWWGGYRLTPDYWEFWQGRKSRLHDRISYRLIDGTWRKQRLAP